MSLMRIIFLIHSIIFCHHTLIYSDEGQKGLANDMVPTQPRPQGFSLRKWVGREKALASAGHVSSRTP